MNRAMSLNLCLSRNRIGPVKVELELELRMLSVEHVDICTLFNSSTSTQIFHQISSHNFTTVYSGFQSRHSKKIHDSASSLNHQTVGC